MEAMCIEANLRATHSSAVALVKKFYGSDHNIWINVGVNAFVSLIKEKGKKLALAGYCFAFLRCSERLMSTTLF